MSDRDHEAWCDRYILKKDGETPVKCPDLMRWGRWMEEAEHRVVAMSTVGDTEVSTIFLGLDHSFGGKGGPVLWETMIFQPGARHGRPELPEFEDRAAWADYDKALGPMDGKQWRWRSAAEAREGHQRVVAALKDVTVELPA